MKGRNRVIGFAVVMVLIAMVFCLTGCGNRVSEDDVKAALEQKDAGSLTALIKQYSEGDGQGNREELDQLVKDDFTKLSSSKDYGDFEYMQQVAAKTGDLAIGAELSKILESSRGQMLKAFLEGDWIRKDMSNLDGCVVTMKWQGNTGQALVKDVADILTNDQGLQAADIKWQNVKIVRNKAVVLDDMKKQWGYASYAEAVKVDVDFEKEYMIINHDDIGYGTEGTQVWMRKDYVDSFKQDGVLEDSDFVISGDGLDEENYDLFQKEFSTGERNLYMLFYYDKSQDKSLEGVVKTSRAITLGASEQEVLKAYGMGSRGIFEPESDAICKLIQKTEDQSSLAYLSRKAAYYLHYTVADKSDSYIRFYFDKNDRVTAVVFGSEYPGNSSY